MVLGGADNDTIRATFSAVSAEAAAANTQSGAKVGGNKGDDELFLTVAGTSDEVRLNGNSGADTIVVSAEADSNAFGIAGGKGNDVIRSFTDANTALGGGFCW